MKSWPPTKPLVCVGLALAIRVCRVTSTRGVLFAAILLLIATLSQLALAAPKEEAPVEVAQPTEAPYGNEVCYVYDLADGNQRYLTDIFYTQPPGAAQPIDSSAWAYHVHLTYEMRTDPATGYRRGWEIVTRYRLETVEVSAKDDA